MRKGAGISALHRHTNTTTSYSSLSASISSSQLASLELSLAQFKEHLLQFARAHRADIRRDPAFRHQFQKMCAAIGVDPLQGGGPRGRSSGSGSGGGGGWWADVLGLGEWQFELAVQVVDVCVSTRARNGGMISMPDLIAGVMRLRSGGSSAAAVEGEGGGGADVTEPDIIRSLALLAPLSSSSGYTTLSLGGITYVRSVPKELDTDQTMLVLLARDGAVPGRLEPEDVMRRAGWTSVRARQALEDAVMREGIAWVDEQEDGERSVWIMAAVEFAEA